MTDDERVERVWDDGYRAAVKRIAEWERKRKLQEVRTLAVTLQELPDIDRYTALALLIAHIDIIERR